MLQSRDQLFGIGGLIFRRLVHVREQRLVTPERNTVQPPVAAQSPARQRLARVPLSLAVMQQRAVREGIPQSAQQGGGGGQLFRSQGIGVPLRAVHVVDGNERRLAAHGEPDVPRGDVPVHVMAQSLDPPPLRVGIREGDARIFMDTRHVHLMLEGDLAGIHAAGYRRRSRRLRRGRQRNVPFPGEQSGGRVQADPPRAGQVHFGPGVQVREIARRPFGPFQRLHIGL